jgi:hypothetical protein
MFRSSLPVCLDLPLCVSASLSEYVCLRLCLFDSLHRYVMPCSSHLCAALFAGARPTAGTGAWPWTGVALLSPPLLCLCMCLHCYHYWWRSRHVCLSLLSCLSMRLCLSTSLNRCISMSVLACLSHVLRCSQGPDPEPEPEPGPVPPPPEPEPAPTPPEPEPAPGPV